MRSGRGTDRGVAGGLVLLLALGCAPANEASLDDPFTAEPISVSGPELRIGSLEGPDDAFQRITALAEAPDGRLFSAHAIEGVIKLWSAEGAYEGSLGRRGDGPGEFNALRDLGFFGDTLWAWDPGAPRVTLFGPSGELSGTLAGRVVESGGGAVPRVERPLRNGGFLAVEATPASALATGEVAESAWLHVGGDGRVLGRVAVRDHRSTDMLSLPLGEQMLMATQMIQDWPLSQASDHGLTVVHRRVWDGAGTPGVTVLRLDFAGDTVARFDLPYEPVRIDDALFDRIVEDAVDRMIGVFEQFRPGVARGDLTADYHEHAYRPGYMPAVSTLVVADDGSVWLQATPETVEGPTWWVLDTELAPVGRVRTPEGFRLLAVHGDRLWGSETDELDVPYIVRYRADPH